MPNDSDEYPLLGEPLSVELLNSLYVDPDGSIDFLGDKTRVEGWLSAAAGNNLSTSAPVTATHVRELRELRSAVRTLAIPAPQHSPAQLDRAIAVVNRIAALRPSAPRLIRDPGGNMNLDSETCHETVEGLLSSIAAHIVAIITDDSVGSISVCDRPECNMHYLRRHHRRRYCNPRCASADRQSRYYRRTQMAPQK